MICSVTITYQGLKDALQDWLNKRVSEGHEAAAQICEIYLDERSNGTTSIAPQDRIIIRLQGPT